MPPGNGMAGESFVAKPSVGELLRLDGVALSQALGLSVADARREIARMPAARRTATFPKRRCRDLVTACRSLAGSEASERLVVLSIHVGDVGEGPPMK